MNEQGQSSSPDLPELSDLQDSQVRRFRDLIEEVLQCCQARTVYLARQFGLPQAEVRLLMLFQGERYLTVKGMSLRLDVAKSRVTKLVQDLEEKGLVEVVDDPRDARVRLVSLTVRGQAKAAEIASFTEQLHRKILQAVPAGERKAVLASLDTLRSSMEDLKKRLLG